MSDRPQDEIPLRPILPRNLTARADLVPGNPMIARPESGVANTHPGLELDVRALDRHFLPGLVFDFQYRAGAKLVRVEPDRLSAADAPTRADLEQGIFLWAVRGGFGDEPEKTKTVNLIEVDGYMVLRRIMDLEPGPVTVLVGPLPRTPAERIECDAVVTALEDDQCKAHSERRNGRLLYACVTGERAAFLTPDGVLDPDLIEPGELTQSLCSPWQWDFADCHCYYWASSKPDIVISGSGNAQVLNFLRDRSTPEPDRPITDPKAWRKIAMTQQAIINKWESLSVVVAERESGAAQRPRWLPPSEPTSLRTITRTLAMLAGREHALCVEYLFAAYSIRAPRQLPPFFRRSARRRYRAAREVLDVAVEEMRHFRWVNEALWLLGAVPTVERAKQVQPQMRRSFELRPLLPSVLDEFIDIEAPSSTYQDPQQLDGMYTSILVSLHHLEQDPHCRDDREVLHRLKQLVKVIVDEGIDHWERFRRVKQHLAGGRPGSYLRFTADQGWASSEPWRSMQELCNAYYDLLLRALYITFWLGRRSPPLWLGIARRTMETLNDMAYHLAEETYAPRFCLPNWVSDPVEEPVDAMQVRYVPASSRNLFGVDPHVKAILAIVPLAMALIDRIEAAAPWRLRRVAAQHRGRLTETWARVTQYAEQQVAPEGHSSYSYP